MLNSIKNFFVSIWNTIVDIYISYDEFIHSLVPGVAGDLIVVVINIIIVIIILKSLSFGAFKK